MAGNRRPSKTGLRWMSNPIAPELLAKDIDFVPPKERVGRDYTSPCARLEQGGNTDHMMRFRSPILSWRYEDTNPNRRGNRDPGVAVLRRNEPV
jgi:hypothetical protein